MPKIKVNIQLLNEIEPGKTKIKLFNLKHQFYPDFYILKLTMNYNMYESYKKFVVEVLNCDNICPRGGIFDIDDEIFSYLLLIADEVDNKGI